MVLEKHENVHGWRIGASAWVALVGEIGQNCASAGHFRQDLVSNKILNSYWVGPIME
jgi:hypothetical protein